jgi:REP element-mobilizing transposase RayT
MPRKARTDAPGALHHIIARGIERRAIFTDNADRENYLGRLETIVTETHTSCYAWALIPNHFPPDVGEPAPCRFLLLYAGY